MQRTKIQFFIPALVLLTFVACAEPASETSPEIERGLVIDENGDFVRGSFTDDEHTLRFRGEVAGDSFEAHIEINGMTITARLDDQGLLSYDGYTNGGGAAPHMSDDDRAALTALADALDGLGAEVDPATARVRSFANIWSEFPSSLDLRGVTDASFRGTKSLCHRFNKYVRVTHDDWTYPKWHDRTTFHALMSMDEAGPCSEDGTWFLTGGKWKCYEPDHSATVEYAYGNCFGRCGNRCGSSTQFTSDCANLDSCQRFGHTITSPECDDEFLDALDDGFTAPNCL